jgi:hypothetical protein
MDDRQWRKRLDIRDWLTAKTQAGLDLQLAVDALFTKNVEHPNHPHVYVTLGVNKIRQALLLTDHGRRVHTLFASTYWDEQGYHMDRFLGDETNDTEIKATLNYYAVLLLNHLNSYAKEVLNYWDFMPRLTTNILTLGGSTALPTPSVIHRGDTSESESSHEDD